VFTPNINNAPDILSKMIKLCPVGVLCQVGSNVLAVSDQAILVLFCVAVCCSVLQRVAACYSVLQCVAVCCSLLRCVAVCCSVLQCVAVACRVRWTNLGCKPMPMEQSTMRGYLFLFSRGLVTQHQDLVTLLTR